MAPMFAQLKSHGDLHIQRKIFHFVSIFNIFLCTVFFSPETNWIIYLALGVPALMIDILRQKLPRLNRIALKIGSSILRKREIRNLSGASYAIIAIGFVYLFFPRPIAQLSILFLAIGDPIASFFGLLFGKHHVFGKKSFEGFAAAFIFCTMAGYAFFSLQANYSALILLSLICGFIAAIAELIPVAKIDDNLTQPLISCALMTLTFYFWGDLI